MTVALQYPPGSLQVERMRDGRRCLLRDLILHIDAEKVLIPAGFQTDFSSWPRFLPGPRFDRIDLAGVVHDYCFKHATLGQVGRAVGYVESNRIWFRVARAGESGASWVGAWTGRLGLFVGSWPTWWGYRNNNG